MKVGSSENAYLDLSLNIQKICFKRCGRCFSS